MTPIPRPALSDGVIRLRAENARDAGAHAAAFADPEFLRFSDWHPLTHDAIVDRIRTQEVLREEGVGIAFSVTDAAESTALGEVTVNGIDHTTSVASIGYWLTPTARGRGTSTRAVRLVARWALGDLGLERLEITCGPDNDASRRVAERSGFHFEGRLRSHVPFKGHRRDSLLFSLTRPDLPAD
ncbi:GNAT family N-acetyltransferase [Brachybacterium sp. ACRRE]|uniref:GNAT family N-acetyltransferase n=1 Tax=Brachybacterium sp. ACRRE TaxID=2918184 RepID=UPI001EF2A09C|nr:GNAT family protein [Brachybacterium sp. ACRRE]MCG7307919.1 GNAT family N-acetyltransferase [Brachybacterium sp. ACRRE]